MWGSVRSKRLVERAAHSALAREHLFKIGLHFLAETHFVQVHAEDVLVGEDGLQLALARGGIAHTDVGQVRLQLGQQGIGARREGLAGIVHGSR